MKILTMYTQLTFWAAVIFLILFLLYVKSDLKNWKDIPGFKPEEEKGFAIPFGFKDGNLNTIRVTYVETHLYHNLWCKLKHIIKWK